MATTFCVSGAVLAKAGAGVSDTIKAGGGSSGLAIGADYAVDAWINDAESRINTNSRFNFTDGFSNLNSDTKLILREVASNLAAVYAITYDMGGYTSRSEAESIINVLLLNADEGLKQLKDKKQVDFIDGS